MIMKLFGYEFIVRKAEPLKAEHRDIVSIFSKPLTKEDAEAVNKSFRLTAHSLAEMKRFH